MDWITTNWQTLITWCISVLTVCLSYFLGSRQAISNRKYDQAKKRYETFYVPFFAKLYTWHMWEFIYSHQENSHRMEFVNLITDNIAMLDYHTQKLIPAFFDAYLDLLQGERIDASVLPGAQATVDRLFDQIIESSAREADRLSRSLHLPSIARAYAKRHKADANARNTRKERA